MSTAESILERFELEALTILQKRILNDACYQANVISSSSDTDKDGRSFIQYRLFFEDKSRLSYTEYVDGIEPVFVKAFASGGF